MLVFYNTKCLFQYLKFLYVFRFVCKMVFPHLVLRNVCPSLCSMVTRFQVIKFLDPWPICGAKLVSITTGVYTARSGERRGRCDTFSAVECDDALVMARNDDEKVSFDVGVFFWRDDSRDEASTAANSLWTTRQSADINRSHSARSQRAVCVRTTTLGTCSPIVFVHVLVQTCLMTLKEDAPAL